MKRENFNEIIHKVEVLSLNAKEETNKVVKINIYSVKDLNELETIRTNLSSLQSEIDRILKVDFYHIVGMGKLNGAQILTINKKIKQLGQDGDSVKRGISIINGMKTIYASLNSESVYKCNSSIGETFTNDSSFGQSKSK